MDQRDVVVVAEQADHLLALAQPQQAVVDEHALQLIADRLVQQHGHHRGVDAARQAADHRLLPTWARIWAMARSLKAAIVQSPLKPAILSAKLRSSLAPSGVCITSGWNCTP